MESSAVKLMAPTGRFVHRYRFTTGWLVLVVLAMILVAVARGGP
jgi:hypothetical protein